MTVSYHLELASVSPLSFLGVLFRWKGSVWKHVYKELLIWTTAYLAISFFYRSPYFLNIEQKHTFENLARYFNERLEYIPLTFILGFFVNTIVSRWSDIFNNMGYIESYAICIGNYIRGEDEGTRWLRRTLVRYLCLTQVLVFRDISVRVRKRFPTIDSIIDAGILLKEEKEKLESIKLQYNVYWAPIRWIQAIALKARREEKMTSDIMYNKLCDEVNKFRYNLQLLCNYDWVPLPLVYSQAVFLAVYVHFAVCLVSRQFIVTDRAKGSFKSDIDLIIPLMTMIQFLFFIGWLKVAQALLNPFGDDDDDFECNYLIDKNLATSLCIVDNHDRVPEVQPDRFWLSHKAPAVSSAVRLIGSAVNARLQLTAEQSQMVIRRPSEIRTSASFDFGRRLSRVFFQTSSQNSAKLEQVFPQAGKNRENLYRRKKRGRLSASVTIGDLKNIGNDHRTDLFNQRIGEPKTSNTNGKLNQPKYLPNTDFVPPDPIPSDAAAEMTRL